MSPQAYAQPQAQPTEKCRPPADTPAGAIAYLTNGAVDIPYRWSGRRWISTYIQDRSHTPSALARRGWWFDRVVATPSAEGTPT